MGFTAAAIIGSAVVGGVGSAIEGAKGRKAASSANDQAMAQFAGIDLPSLSDQELSLLLPSIVGEYDPEVLKSLDLDPSSMEDINIDAGLKEQQLRALAGMVILHLNRRQRS